MELHHKIYRTILLAAGAFLIINAANAQTVTQNYVRTRVPRVAITTATRLDQLTTVKDSVMTTIQYFDGLGRPLQTVQRQGSPSGKDIVQPFTYDSYGREAQKYLPYGNTGTSYGSYRDDAFSATSGVKTFYNPSNATTEGKQNNGIVLTQYPYATTVFEPSPLNRVVEQGGPGAAWQVSANSGTDHTNRVAFTTNDQMGFDTTNITSSNMGSRKGALYTASINTDGSRSLLGTGSAITYASGQLMVTISKDENWKAGDGCFGTTEEYKDKDGHVMLKRTYNVKGATAEMLSTFYVHDDMGNLAFVLPPGASPDAPAAISQAILDSRCYQYRYDARGRLYQKKVPGKGWEFMIYNQLDQVIGTQDSVQRMKATQEWTISKYDALGRPVITGIFQYGSGGSDNRATLQAVADTVTAQWEMRISTGIGYTGNAWPKTFSTTLNATYYDTYKGIPDFPGWYDRTTAAAYSQRTNGLVTATKTLVLNTTADYLWTVPYYDEEGKVLRTFNQHYLGGTSMLSVFNYNDVVSAYFFTKEPIFTKQYHYVANTTKTAAIPTLTSTETYSYDHMGRKRFSYSQLQDGINAAQPRILISMATYNEIGQLAKKGLHSVDNASHFLQNVDYRYNARGWLTNINNPSLNIDGGLTNTDTNDQFGMELQYDNAATRQYNGNIGNVKSLTGSLRTNNYPALTYNYTYDKLNRLVNAKSTTTTANDNFYNENVAYDVMGNITKLNRYDKVDTTRKAIDSLTYTYVSGSKVDQVEDKGTTAGFMNNASQAGEYTYDGNGNQLADLNKGLTQTYNMLNLPQTASKAGVSVAYIYDATGRKLRKLVTMGSTVNTTEYINGIQYEYAGGATPAIAFIQTEEGRARKSGSLYKYEYDLKDHLGNTRMTTTWDTSDATQRTPLNTQRSDYYAFGYTIQSLQGNTPGSKNQYLYNGKELQDETGLYDYGARFYDPVIGRWTSVDPLVELGQESGTPYGYVFDNPMKYTDPDGRVPDITIDGANNSSVTIKTDLIDVRVNASSLGVDFGGNYTVQGDEIIGAALDIVGIFDPTPISDGLSAGLSAKKGDWFSAGISVLGMIPYAGDLAKVGKIKKDVKIVEEAIDAVKAEGKIAKAEGKAAEELQSALPSPGKGRGTVPPGQRDPKRLYSKDDIAGKLEQQGGKCAKCGVPKKASEVRGHHKTRHADGGKTNSGNLAAVCEGCHIEIHK
jgi:RHS repeat-associated protein